ncbi:VOC family protein [Calidifontibacter terrae]
MTDITANLAMVTIDCSDARAMAQFWSQLLGGEITHDEGDYAMVKAGDTTLGFGRSDDYTPPTWPDNGHKQFHLDLSVQDLDAARDRAQELGATIAEPQPTEAAGKWVVMLDPSGHPFCFAVWG